MAIIGSDLERQERMFDREIRTDHQHGFAFVKISRRGECSVRARQRVHKRRYVTRAVMIDIVRAEALPGKLLEVEVLFISRVVRADDAETATALFHGSE